MILLKYCSGDFKYGDSVYDINRIVLPYENSTVDELKTKFPFVVEREVVMDNGVVEYPYGYPNLLVIDATDPMNVIVREKNDNEKLVDLKPQKLLQFKQSYETILSEGFVTSYGFKVDCAPEDVANWTSTLKLIDLAVELGKPLTEISIADYDNISRVLSVLDFKIMCIEVGQYVQYLMNKKWRKRNYVENSVTTLEQLNLVTWDSNELE